MDLTKRVPRTIIDRPPNGSIAGSTSFDEAANGSGTISVLKASASSELTVCGVLFETTSTVDGEKRVWTLSKAEFETARDNCGGLPGEECGTVLCTNCDEGSELYVNDQNDFNV